MTPHQASFSTGHTVWRSPRGKRRLIIAQLSVLTAIAFALGLMSVNARAGDDAPPWLRAAAGLSIPAFQKEVPAVVLADESVVTIDDDGRMTRNDFYAVKVLTRKGAMRL